MTARVAVIVLAAALVTATAVGGQGMYSSGQNIVPVFEGWERNADGSFTLLFGYFNRNREEVVDIPVGRDNVFEPGVADRGQPTRFYPSRNRYWFTVQVPADFGAQELVWTLTSRGKTERAYATLHPNYASDPTIRQLDMAGINLWWAEAGVNRAPSLRIEGGTARRVRVGEAVTLSPVSSLDALDGLIGRSRRARIVPMVHVDVDTGMGRTGFDWRKARAWMPRVLAAAQGEMQWVGCYTHLHSADEDEWSVREQWTRMQEVLDQVPDAPSGLMIHMLNSAGALRLPEFAHAAVRPGIFLYGGEVGAGQPVPEAVVSVHARVIHVRDAEPGATVGYGATYRASGPEMWATLAIGYGDGLRRTLGNRGHALIQGAKVRIIGRISMDMTVVDISGVPGVRVGDVATLLGTAGRESITVDDVAELAGTISYEVLTGFTPRLPRVWTGLDES